MNESSFVLAYRSSYGKAEEQLASAVAGGGNGALNGTPSLISAPLEGINAGSKAAITWLNSDFSKTEHSFSLRYTV